MGSFQQISVAVVCVVAAFAFGNYVNNHPPTDPNQVAIKTQSEQALQPGNVQSRLTVAGLEVVEKRPAPIATMRQPIKPRFSLPYSSAQNNLPVETHVTDSNTDSNSATLPPPSQLGWREGSPNEKTISNFPTVSRRAIKTDEVPDFSSIIEEFKDSAIALPANKNRSLGNMPVYSRTESQTAIAKTPQQRGRAQLFQDPPDFANQTSQDPKSSPWNTEGRQPFSDDDFAPRLKDRLDGRLAAEQSRGFTDAPLPDKQSAIASRIRSPQGFAKSYGFTFNDPPSPDYASDEPPHQASIITTVPEVAMSGSPDGLITEPPPANSQLAPINRGGNLNHVVSRQPLPAYGNDAVDNSRIESGSMNMPNLTTPRQNSLARISSDAQNSYQGSTVVQSKLLQSKAPMNDNKVRTMLPFGLNEQGRSQLVAIKSRASTQLESSSTRFVDHVIQPGETLQSISKRYFGKPDYYLDIYLANRAKLNNPVDTPDGTAIRIPVY